MIPGTQPSPAKVYPGSADEDSKNVFDMSVNDTSMYGNYSVGAATVTEGVSATSYIDPEVTLTAPLSTQLITVINQIIENNMGPYLDDEGDHLNGGSF
jgi:hypothetical protein